jgi:hypothetical protein
MVPAHLSPHILFKNLSQKNYIQYYVVACTWTTWNKRINKDFFSLTHNFQMRPVDVSLFSKKKKQEAKYEKEIKTKLVTRTAVAIV